MRNNISSYLKEKAQRYVNYILIILSVLLAISLVRNVFRIRRIEGTIVEEEKTVEDLKKENESLKEEVQVLGSDEYKDKELRDKLGLAKEGETVVVLPDEEVLRKLAPKHYDEADSLPDPNWKKWVNLFF